MSDIQTALVTGGGGGIGGGIARALAGDGMQVVVADHKADAADEVAEDIRRQGGKAQAVKVDVTDRAQVIDLTSSLVGEYGRLDQLWNSAGVTHVDPLLEIPEETWRRVFDVNVHGAFFASQAVLPQMLELQPDPTTGCRGKIVNIGSAASLNGRPLLAAYGASKAALNHLTKSIAAAHGNAGICATVLFPGNVWEGMWQEIDRRWSELEGVAPGEMARRRMESSATGRFQTTEEIGAVARYVARARGSDLNGKIVVSDVLVMDA